MSLSKKNPELLDAGITGWFFFRDREKHVGKAPLVGFFDFFKVRKAFLYFYPIPFSQPVSFFSLITILNTQKQ